MFVLLLLLAADLRTGHSSLSKDAQTVTVTNWAIISKLTALDAVGKCTFRVGQSWDKKAHVTMPQDHANIQVNTCNISFRLPGTFFDSFVLA